MSKPKVDMDTALADLRKAIDALCEPRLEYLDGRFLKSPNLIEQLRASVEGMQGTGNGHAARSMPPLWIDAVSALDDIDVWCAAMGIGWPGAAGNLPWEQVRDVQKATRIIAGWVKHITQLLDPPRKFSLTAACPNCSAKTAKHVDSAGETVNGPALQIIPDTGCVCQECGHTWPPELYRLLASVLQLPLPAGVTE